MTRNRMELDSQRGVKAVCLWVLLAAWSGTAIAATVTINPEDTSIYQGTDATQADSNFEDNSCGAGSNLFSGVTNDGLLRRTLVRFDIAANVPPGAIINSVSLSMTVTRSGDNQDAAMVLNPVSQNWNAGTQNCDAVRGGGMGIDAADADATWLDARFNQQAWSSGGGDYGAQSASAIVGTGNGSEALWDSAGNPLMLSDVQSWLDNPAGNFGWIVIGEESRAATTRRFSSSEGNSPPALVVDFTGDGFACCFDNGDCSIQAELDCAAQGGSADLSQTSCEPNPCPQPFGACCNRDESCTDSIARDECEGGGGVFNGAASQCQDNQVDCGLEPFVDALPIPPVLQPIGTRSDGTLQYLVEVVAASQQLHRDLSATDLWTYNGAYPSYTIEARVNEPIEVTYANNLPTAKGRRGSHMLEVDECAHGPNYYGDSARIVTHLHGGHVPARVDGHPEMTILPGEIDTYEYPNNQLPGTLWYHDHALGTTRLNVYAGMAGFYLLRDDYEDNLGLPSGEFEIAAVIQDREFNPDGSLFYPPTIQNAFFGDKVLVNGKVWPYLDVKQGKYRIRFLNGSQARQYVLRLENLSDPAQVIPFTLIGTDLGLVTAPITLDTIDPIVGAERFDVVIDFAGFAPGTEIVLRNDDPTVPLLPNVMKFVVTDQPGFTAPIPAALRTVTPIQESEATVNRWFRLENVPEGCTGNEWLVRTLDGPQGNVVPNAEHWDDITEFPLLGATEIWEFENPSNIMHPMHVHLVAFQILDRRSLAGGTSIALDAHEVNTWKDTVKVTPGTVVRVIARFDDYLGKFPYHCHILDHEDHEMMRQFQMVNDPANCDDDGTCDPSEDCVSCPGDCAQLSGALCGNGLCEAGDGENCITCPDDCAGKQKGSSSRQFCCGTDDGSAVNPILCGDGPNSGDTRCVDASSNLYCRIAPRLDACCGDALCEGEEAEASCAVDCAPASACVPTGIPDDNCDGVDDNCDGAADESYVPLPSSCGTGECGATGQLECLGGSVVDSCTPATPPEATEVTCDDTLDNDCDGSTDGADTDCQVVACSTYQSRQTCRDAGCQWKKNTCNTP